MRSHRTTPPITKPDTGKVNQPNNDPPGRNENTTKIKIKVKKIIAHSPTPRAPSSRSMFKLLLGLEL